MRSFGANGATWPALPAQTGHVPSRYPHTSSEIVWFTSGLRGGLLKTCPNFYHTLQRPCDDTVPDPEQSYHRTIFREFQRLHQEWHRSCSCEAETAPPHKDGPAISLFQFSSIRLLSLFSILVFYFFLSFHIAIFSKNENKIKSQQFLNSSIFLKMWTVSKFSNIIFIYWISIEF